MKPSTHGPRAAIYARVSSAQQAEGGTIASQVAAGRYKAKPVRVFRFEDIREAHRVMESNQAGGKMVVLV